MPYDNQSASKLGHVDLLKDGKITDYVKKCSTKISDTSKMVDEFKQYFKPIPESNWNIKEVVASDASVSSKPLVQGFPSTQIGIVKVSLLRLEVEPFDNAVSESGFVDPFEMAKTQRNTEWLGLMVPGSNVLYGGADTIVNGFRKALWEQFSTPYGFGLEEGKKFYSLADFVEGTIKGQRKIEKKTGHTDKCPLCGISFKTPISFKLGEYFCPNCQNTVYITDLLKMHELVIEHGDNTQVINGVMNLAEHLSMATLISNILNIAMTHQDPEIVKKVKSSLSQSAFIIDGPLSLFGPCARFHQNLMLFYHQVTQTMNGFGLPPPVVFSLQKTGILMEHGQAISKHIANDSFALIDDNYRNTYIQSKLGGVGTPSNLFGEKSSYGQDFLLKSQRGQMFAVSLPYPSITKGNAFLSKVFNPSNYPTLGAAISLVNKFELDLYKNAVIPVALAHRHASLSLMPASKLFKELGEKHIGPTVTPSPSKPGL